MSLPSISVVVEASNWNPAHQIQIFDTLRALHRQSFPISETEILVVLDAPHHSAADSILEKFPRVVIRKAPAEMTYYELKNLGGENAQGEIIAFTDADCVPSTTWIEQIVHTFRTSGENVAAIQGSTRFSPRALARAWESSWWVRSFENEGIVDRLYTSNNMAVRRKIFLRFRFLDGTNMRAGLERPMTRELQAAGFHIWLNPNMIVHHNYTPSIREIVQMSLVRGYNFLRLRRNYPGKHDSILKMLGWLSPLFCAPVLMFKDMARLLINSKKMKLWPAEFYKIPIFLLLQIPYDVIAIGGMYWAIWNEDDVPRRPL
ncbi:MAG: hypothetical protein C5B54_11135 [Acidobacteria bacterium]|nr:MAG: hypothetical protein C5B54_11135 [Acidobacteriota bacterium]